MWQRRRVAERLCQARPVVRLLARLRARPDLTQLNHCSLSWRECAVGETGVECVVGRVSDPAGRRARCSLRARYSRQARHSCRRNHSKVAEPVTFAEPLQAPSTLQSPIPLQSPSTQQAISPLHSPSPLQSPSSLQSPSPPQVSRSVFQRYTRQIQLKSQHIKLVESEAEVLACDEAGFVGVWYCERSAGACGAWAVAVCCRRRLADVIGGGPKLRRPGGEKKKKKGAEYQGAYFIPSKDT